MSIDLSLVIDKGKFIIAILVIHVFIIIFMVWVILMPIRVVNGEYFNVFKFSNALIHVLTHQVRYDLK
jgi:hypothetical protein